MRILENTPRRVRLRSLSYSSWYLLRWFVVALWLVALASIGAVAAAIHFGAAMNILQSTVIAAALFFVMAIEFTLPERVEVIADLDEGAVTILEKPLLTLLGSAGNNSFREPTRFRCGLSNFEAIELSEPRTPASDGPAYWLHGRTTDGLRRLACGVYVGTITEQARASIETFNKQVRVLRGDPAPTETTSAPTDEPKESAVDDGSSESDKPTRPVL